MSYREIETRGQLSLEEVKALNSWDIVMVREKNNHAMWAVGDVWTLQQAKTWGEDYVVFNIGTVPPASRSAHRRWVVENWMGKTDDERF